MDKDEYILLLENLRWKKNLDVPTVALLNIEF